MTMGTAMIATIATSATHANGTTEGAVGATTTMMTVHAASRPTRGGHAPSDKGCSTRSSPRGFELRQTSQV
jgi:hypothetical protein